MKRIRLVSIAIATLVAAATPALASEPFSDGGNSCATADGFYPYGQNGTIGYAGDIDYYVLRFTGCGTLNIGSTGTTDTYGYLLDANCRVIAQNDDANGSYNFNISGRLNAGVYYLAVRHYNRFGTGNYRLGFTFAAGASGQCGICR